MAPLPRLSIAGLLVSPGCSYRRRILAEPHRLQPDPHPEIGCRIGELRKETRKSLLCRANRLNHQHKAPYGTAKAQISRFFRKLLKALEPYSLNARSKFLAPEKAFSWAAPIRADVTSVPLKFV